MTSRLVKVGRGHRRTDQIVTTTYTTEDDGALHEHVTLETPDPLSDTAIQRMAVLRESQKVWP